MAWEAPHLLPLVLLVLLASGSWEQQPETLRKLEGEEVSVRRGPEPGNPRYVIRDYPLLGYFTVTMTVLAETDSGLYWCGLYESPGIDILRTIRLAVSRVPLKTPAWLPSLPSCSVSWGPGAHTSAARSFSAQAWAHCPLHVGHGARPWKGNRNPETYK
ncbi:Trem-like transcript 4 protein [Myotis brandtii]|uniref:Trem-like transcript 4 protein n=1 Tax=Myotis brandtii TaxID=109478 RepID=S7NSE7_MYOBR|nr:Trem-like transcript 4 protein [Myotis brandtii]